MKILNESERQSATWIKLKDHLERRIGFLHRTLEGDQSETKTAMIRGRISEIRRLIREGDPDPIIENNKVDYS